MLYYLFLQSLNSRCQLIKLSHVDPIKKNSFKKKKKTQSWAWTKLNMVYCVRANCIEGKGYP